MLSSPFRQTGPFLSTLLLLALLAPAVPAQDEEDVVRVSTELVQTDVMVFDKQGRFVEGLKPEQFELKVDGKVQTISFFERIVAGSVNEDAQLAAARGGARTASATVGSPVPLDRGRTVFFFVDDLHLSPESAMRLRKTLLNFIEEEIGQNDQAVVSSASGQVGFLQQLTSEKAVLRAAVGRISPRDYSVRDGQRPRMSEVQALAVEQNDRDVIEYFVQELIRETPGLAPETARTLVTQRARNIMMTSTSVTTNTLLALESTVRNLSPIPGRKIGFFISDGFLLNMNESGLRDRMRRITDAAARSGVVIYTMGAQGLTTGLPDASAEVNFDPSGRLARVNLGELSARQEPLRTLAADTGGRAILNTNALGTAVNKALEETSVYYLLAWRPEPDGERDKAKFRRVEVRVKDRPDLNVLVRRGFYSTPPEPERTQEKKSADVKQQAATVERELVKALTAIYPQSSIPTRLSLGFISPQTGDPLLTASVEMEPSTLSFVQEKGQPVAKVDVASVAYDERGKSAANFRQLLTIRPPPSDVDPAPLVFSHTFRLKPGLYQVRFAARDGRTGRTGSASEWVVIPDLQKGELALSSIFVGQRDAKSAAEQKDPQEVGEASFSVSRRFRRSDLLRFATYVYNASVGPASQPDVAVQVQVFRDDQPVLTSPLSKIASLPSDHKTIPYVAELPLERFPVGNYVLRITAIDRAAKTSATQRVNFVIE